MGDRVIVQFVSSKSTDHEDSPTVYMHWGGEAAPALLQKWWEYMENRRGDIGYGCARFIGLAHERFKGNLSLGVYKEQTFGGDEDAGKYVVDVATGEVTASGGYGKSFTLKS